MNDDTEYYTVKLTDGQRYIIPNAEVINETWRFIRFMNKDDEMLAMFNKKHVIYYHHGRPV